tara:strand:- start:29 stop:340 length:312 start_codon:yes stop_codon:yes gene_type:complete
MFNITGGKGFQITFPNNWTISVQFGPFNYRDDRSLYVPYATTYDSMQSVNAEVAVWDGNGIWKQLGDNDDVIGWQSPEEVLKLMNEIAAYDAVEPVTEDNEDA